jgi:ABC-type multidrug transport system fused ATPase/permease subunit
MFGSGSLENLEAIKQWDSDMQKKLNLGKGVIEFKNVHAKYHNSKEDVLKGVNLKIEPGKKIGIIGRTGSGKSTIMKLLWKYMDANQGEILLDGKNYQDLGNYIIRSHMAIVTQDVNLVEGTVLSNIFPKLIPPTLANLDKATTEKLLSLLEKLQFQKHFNP